jgi:hypothetical protein
MKLFYIAMFVSLGFLSGCNSPPARVSSYQGLTLHGDIEEAGGQQTLPPNLINESVALVTGANFERYIVEFDKQNENVERGALLGMLGSRREFAVMLEATNPKSITGAIVLSLKRNFGQILPVRDFPDALANRVRWITMVDFSREGDFYVTTLDLLDGNLKRFVHVEKKIEPESVPFSLSDREIARNVALVNSKAIRYSVTQATAEFEKMVQERIARN